MRKTINISTSFRWWGFLNTSVHPISLITPPSIFLMLIDRQSGYSGANPDISMR